MSRRAGAGTAAISLQMFLFMTFGSFSNSSYSPLSIFIQPDFRISSVQLGLITSAIFVGSMTMYFFVGILVDRFGYRFAIISAFLLIASGSMIAVFAADYLELIAGYYIMGFGYGTITPATNSAIMEHYYPEHSTAMGIKQSGVPVGAALAALALPVIALRFSLRYSFLLIVAVSVISMIMAAFFTARGRKAEANDYGQYIRELVRTLFRDRLLIVISLGTAALSWGQQTVLTYYAVFMHSLGYQRYLAEILLFFVLAGAVFGRILWMKLGQRLFGRDRVAALSLITFLAGAMVLLFPVITFDVYVSAVMAFLLGMNVVAWNSTYVTVVSEMAPRSEVGLYSGASLIYIGLGTILGTPLSGSVIDYTGSYYDMWVVLGAGIIITAAVFATLVRSIYRKKVGVAQA